MKSLKRIRYYTMNSCNLSTAPAYNLKIYNVIDHDLRGKVYELMETGELWDSINLLIHDFDALFSYQWQAGFNGRSGGYLVLYRGGTREGHKSICQMCGQRNFKTIEETGDNQCGRCGKMARVNRDLPIIYSQPGRHIDDNEVPIDVKKAFRQLAVDIVGTTEALARNYDIVDETYTVEKTRKVLSEK